MTREMNPSEEIPHPPMVRQGFSGINGQGRRKSTIVYSPATTVKISISAQNTNAAQSLHISHIYF